MRMGHLLLLEIVFVVNNNFSIHGRCPSSILLFDKGSKFPIFWHVNRRRYFCKTQVNNIEDLSGHFLANKEHEIRELYNIRVRESRDRFMGNDTVGAEELYRVITIEDYDRVYDQLPAHVYYSQDTDNIAFELISDDNKDLYYTCLREQMKSHPRSFYEIYDTREYHQRKKSAFFKWYPEEEYAIET